MARLTRHPLVIGALAAGTGLLMASIVAPGKAAFTDSVVVGGNALESNEVTPPPPAQDLKAALTDSDQGCNVRLLGDGPFARWFSGDLDLDRGYDFPETGTGRATSDRVFVCVENAGTEPAQLVVHARGVENVELAPCPTSESDAGDTTCDVGEPGELTQSVRSDRLLLLDVDPFDDRCPDWDQQGQFRGTADVTTASSTALAVGSRCLLQLQVIYFGSDEDLYLQGQTESLEFVLVLEGRTMA